MLACQEVSCPNQDLQESCNIHHHLPIDNLEPHTTLTWCRSMCSFKSWNSSDYWPHTAQIKSSEVNTRYMSLQMCMCIDYKSTIITSSILFIFKFFSLILLLWILVVWVFKFVLILAAYWQQSHCLNLSVILILSELFPFILKVLFANIPAMNTCCMNLQVCFNTGCIMTTIALLQLFWNTGLLGVNSVYP